MARLELSLTLSVVKLKLTARDEGTDLSER